MPLLGHVEEARSYRAPVIGDHVISHHQKWAYYTATIVSFDRETLKYTVDWDDGDPTGKVQSYKVCRRNRYILGENEVFTGENSLFTEHGRNLGDPVASFNRSRHRLLPS